jgi:drug/metabolite transporter (DMT)-like permease
MYTKLKQSVPMSVWYMLLSAFAFALMAACVKSASKLGIPVLEIVAARAIVSVLLSYLVVKRKRISIWGNNKPLLLARGGVGACALICVYYALTTLPLAEATILQYLHPIFTAILAVFFLREKIQRSTILCIVFSLVGVAIMIQPNISFDGSVTYPWFSLLVAVLGACGSAVAYILVKKLTKTEDSSVIVFYFPIIAFPISIFLLGNDFVMPTFAVSVLLIMVGVFTQVGQIGLTKALHSADASKAMAYSYVQVIFSILIGWVYFSEVPIITTIIGGSFIIFGALINVLWKR